MMKNELQVPPQNMVDSLLLESIFTKEMCLCQLQVV